jgi:hypothetical protein
MGRLKAIGSRVVTVETRRVMPPPKEADAIYSTTNHRDWRALVVANAGGQCEARDGNHRCWKSEPHVRLYADHIIELKDGGAPFDVSNGQALCARHHTLKTAVEKRRRNGWAGTPEAIPRGG